MQVIVKVTQLKMKLTSFGYSSHLIPYCNRETKYSSGIEVHKVLEASRE